MGQRADLQRRIDVLYARATSDDPDSRLLVEIEDVLAEGYLCALRGDVRSRQLAKRLEALVGDLEQPGVAAQASTLALEQRATDEATRDLRSRLRAMHECWVRLGSERLGLA